MDGVRGSFVLKTQVDTRTGQLLSVHDMDSGVDVLAFQVGHELEVNGVPLQTRLVSVSEAPGEHITVLDAHWSVAYGAGCRLRIRRVLTLGGKWGHTGAADSVHIRYELSREPNTVPGPTTDYIWQPELDAPVRLDSLAVLCAPAKWFGQGTRVRALAIGGTGPREHVSLEDGTPGEVAPHLQSGFRTTFPGQGTVNGAMYYDPADHRFVWNLVRRPYVGGRVCFGAERHAYQFFYFKELQLHDEVMTPAVSLLWGRGMEQADRVLANQFDLYEEPPEWAYHTSWFWLHPLWQRNATFETMGQAAEILMDGGVNGLGLCIHDIPWSGNDVDVASPMPSPRHGGAIELRKVLDRINSRGGHTYAWISQKGHRPDVPGFKDSWNIYGVDGRPVRLHNDPDLGVRLNIVNPADPSFLAYMCEWVRYYVQDLGITGLFWDSGLQPIPPDFGNKPYLRCPGEGMAAMQEFYRRVYQYGRSLSNDFFMWVEGISTDVPMNAFSVDSRTHGVNSGHALMHRIAHAGRRRLVWRSAWTHDLASGFPMINPMNDAGTDGAMQFYRQIAADPMNRWVCRIVRERGVRDAIGLADGVSLLDEYIVVSPGMHKSVIVPVGLCRGERLESVLNGRSVRGVACDAGVRFDLTEAGAFRMCGAVSAPKRVTESVCAPNPVPSSAD